MIIKEEWKVYKNVFSQSSIRNLDRMISAGYFEWLKSPISIGKEANIFSATTKDGTLIIAKIYRVENAEFMKMRQYLSADLRYAKVRNSRRQVIFTWAQREYRNLLIAREFVRVPTPIAFKDNIILMEFVGDENPAPMLKDCYPENPKKFFDSVIDMVEKLWKNGWVHGDLSAFNILNFNEKPYFIDLSQMMPAKCALAEELLVRDVKNICHFFRHDIDVSYEKLAQKIKEDAKKYCKCGAADLITPERMSEMWCRKLNK